MDIATMVAINNLYTANMLNMMAVLQENESIITVMNDRKEYDDMSGSILDQYLGKECVVSLFNEVGAIKGTLMDADVQCVKMETPKKGTQLINRAMIRNISFESK